MPSDFFDFDYVLAMDESNLAQIQRVKPAGSSCFIGLFGGLSNSRRPIPIADPYYGAIDGFTTT